MAESGQQDLELDPLGMTIAGDAPALEKSLRIEGEIEITGNAILGREKSNSVHLGHPRVSRKHAEIRREAGQVLIRDLESTNGTFVNGRRIQGWQVLKPTDRIDIGPFSLRFTGHSLISTTREGNLQIEARNLTQVVPSSGKERRILDDVTLVIEPCTFVALIGPSGSGKSTLMNALSARVPARKGSVLLNGVDLYANFEALKQGLALVPQHDVLHEDLSLEQALYFIAKLRLPDDSTEEDIRAAVQASIERTGLLKRNETPIKSLSGGQKKRASLSGETIHGPNLLFLDEVTSGLDEHTDREMMRLFRQMADSGITVVCVTHTLANVEEFCHKIIIMANPGVLAFYGTPSEAKEYFGVNHLTEVYACLAAGHGSELKRHYRESREYRAHVLERLTPPERQEPPVDLLKARERKAGAMNREMFRQFKILLQRNLMLALADRKTLLIALGQSLLVGLALALVFKDAGPDVQQKRPLLFLLGISCLWFGCNNASKEIVKERPIYRRERDVNLCVSSYVASKVVLLSALGCLQAIVLYILLQKLVGVPGSSALQPLQMVLAALMGTGLGLLISAASESRDQASTIVPIALVPQIVFSGAIVAKMPEAAEKLAQIAMSGYWSFDGMRAVLDKAQKAIATASLVQFLHFAVYVLAAFVILYVRDARGEVRYGDAVKAWLDDTRAGLREAAKHVRTATQ